MSDSLRPHESQHARPPCPSPTPGVHSDSRPLSLRKPQMMHQIPLFKTEGGGPVVKNPPSNAGDVGSIPGWGTKIPHATGQLSPSATSTEPMCCSYRSLQATARTQPSQNLKNNKNELRPHSEVQPTTWRNQKRRSVQVVLLQSGI